MAYKPPKQSIDNNDLKNIPSSEAIYEAFKEKIDQPAVSGTAGQLLQLDGYVNDPDGDPEPLTSWVNPPSGGANTTLSNLTAPTAVNEDLIFNKATAAIIQGSDAKATQANHNLTIRAGDSGSAVGGGNLTLASGASTGGNTGSIFLRLDGGTRIAAQGIYFIDNNSKTQFEINAGGMIADGNIVFRTDNTYLFGASGGGPFNIHNRPRFIFTGTGFYGPWNATGFISGGERIYDNAAASGNLEVRGGDGVAGTSVRATNNAGFLTLRGGDHPGVNSTNAGAVTLRGGNKTAGTGNGGNVTISGGTSVGGTAGSIIINTSGSEVMRITNAGDVGIGTSTPAKKLEVVGAVKADEFTVTRGGGEVYRLDPHTHDEGTETTDFTINWSNGSVHTVTLNAAGPLVITMSNPVDGGAYALRIIQGATPGTVTWPANVKWPGGNPPVLSTNTGDIDVVNLLYYSDTATYYATFALAFA